MIAEQMALLSVVPNWVGDLVGVAVGDPVGDDVGAIQWECNWFIYTAFIPAHPRMFEPHMFDGAL